MTSINWQEILTKAPNAAQFPGVVKHSQAVATYVDELCIQLCVPATIRDRAVALAWLHDSGKAEWLAQADLPLVKRDSENQLALQYLNSLDNLPPEELSDVVRLLGYLNIDVLLGCQFISLPVEPKLVYWADLHCNGSQRVSLDERKRYLYERYFKDSQREEEFPTFWEKRLEFVRRFESWLLATKANIKEAGREVEHIQLSDFIGGWLYPGEPEALAYFAQLTASMQEPACEIGSWRGRSTVCIAGGRSSRSDAKLYCVDDWRGGTDVDCLRIANNFDIFGEFIANTSRYSKYIHPLRGLVCDMAGNIPEKLSFVFLDGDHSLAAVTWECDFFGPRIVIGGVLAFHDCDNPNYPAVRDAVNSLLLTGNWIFLGQTNYLCGLQKVR